MGLPSWSTACPDWETRIVKGEPLVAFPFLFPECAQEALDVFDQLILRDVLGKPTMGQVSRPWVRNFVGHIFGAYENETGRRHISEFLLLISKKNTKSTTAAGIMLTALILNWREDAEFLILSPTIEVANNSFKPAAAMIREDKELDELFHIQDHTRTITHIATNASLKVVAANAETVSGKKAVGVLIDELWLFGKNARAQTMLDEATGGLASAPEGFVIYLTTQSDEPPAGVFKEKLAYARDVRDGVIVDNNFLPVLYEFPAAMIESEAYLDPDNFYVTNPNLGLSVDVPFLLRKFSQVQNGTDKEGDSKQSFLAKHLNVEIGMNLHRDRWPGAGFWMQGEWIEPVSVPFLIEHSEVITGGIDGGGLEDLLGAAMVGRAKKEWPVVIPEHKDKHGNIVPSHVQMLRPWFVWCYAWAHMSVLDRRKDIESLLRDFDKAGELTIVTIPGQDMDELADSFKMVEDSGLLFQIGLDPNALGTILDAMLQAGVPEDKMVSVNQGYRLAGSIRATERKLAEYVLKHGGTGLMKWCVANAKVKVAGNSIVITKQVSGSAKIDPLLALFNAISLMALNPPSQCDSLDFKNIIIGG
jgi:phage terminase large subunit-like protein